MKIRTGFVSNSSSSSFTCQVCSRTESGWDLDLENAGMYECKNGHAFCDRHLAKKDPNVNEKRDELRRWNEEADLEIAQMTDKEVEAEFEKFNNNDEFEEGGTNRYEVMPALCPICALVSVPNGIFVDYLLKRIGTTRDQMVKEIQEQYKTFDELAAACGGKIRKKS